MSGRFESLGRMEVPGFPAREIAVYRPAEHRAEEPAPALLIFDGQNAFEDQPGTPGWHLHRAVEALDRREHAAPLVVAIPHGGPTRMEELTPWRIEGRGGRGDAFLDWVAGALVPRVRSRYRVPEGALGMVLGNTALTKGIKDKVRMSTEIRSLALRAIAADSMHDGAQHLLGRWNYEIMRLSGFERFVAKSVLGGGEFGKANWDEAERRLRRAVELAPDRIYHRLVLARILVARKDSSDAESELRRLISLPDGVAADSTYRREAVEMLARLRER